MGAFTPYDWAWDQPIREPSTKLVLLALAKHANASHRCWPSLTRLQALTGRDRRTVARALDALEKLGLIERTRPKQGSMKSNRYLLCITQGDDTPTPGVKTPSARGGDASSWGCDSPRTVYEPSIEPGGEISTGTTSGRPLTPCAGPNCQTLTPNADGLCGRCFTKAKRAAMGGGASAPPRVLNGARMSRFVRD